MHAGSAVATVEPVNASFARTVRLLVGALVLVSFITGAYPFAAPHFPAARNRAARLERNEGLLDPFRPAGAVPSEQDFEGLFRYFLAGYVTYLAPEGSLVLYPGAASRNGPRADQMEGFSRFVPLIAVWVASGRPRTVSLPTHGSIDLVALVKTGLLNGTNPVSPGYWGEIGPFDQRIVEAADIALALWLLRKDLWAGLSTMERSQIAGWLGRVSRERIHDNNWHLFVVLTNAVLKGLGVAYARDEYFAHYLRFKAFYRGDGWFSDGPDDRFDYYNAWQIHYHLLWIDEIDPDLDRDFIREAYRAFAKTYIRFFSPGGFPILGRSVCYRMATPAPLVLAEALGRSQLMPGQTRRALGATWRYFIARGGVRRGQVTQGYCAEDLRFLDRYSGPASCLWSLRSLVAAFANPPGSPFWATPEASLPVEQQDFDLRIPGAAWRVTGRRADGNVAVTQEGKGVDDSIRIREYRLYARAADTIVAFYGLTQLVGGPRRPWNTAVAYRLPRYSSSEPFCGCPTPVP